MNKLLGKLIPALMLCITTSGNYITAETWTTPEKRAPRPEINPPTSAAYPVADFNLDTIKQEIEKIKQCVKDECAEIKKCYKDCGGKTKCSLNELCRIDKKTLHKVKDIEEDVELIVSVVEQIAQDNCCATVEQVLQTANEILSQDEYCCITIDQIRSVVDEILVESQDCCVSILDRVGDRDDTVSIIDVPNPCDFQQIMDSQFTILQWLKLIYFALCQNEV